MLRHLVVPGGVIGGACIGALYSVTYVGSLYIWKNGVNAKRNEVKTIKQRFVSVTIASTFCLGITHMFFTGRHISEFFALLGFRLPGLVYASIIPIVLFMLLFLGPMALLYCDESFSLRRELYPRFREWTGWRDLIVGPITEEFVFRSLILPLLLASGMPAGASAIYAPFVFGLAHIHHIIHHLNEEKASLQQAILTVVFQLGYTTLFGSLVSYVFMRTGHFIGCLLAHSYCNFMGFPRFGAIKHTKHPRVIWLLFAVGLGGFILLLGPATNPHLYRSPFSSAYDH